MGHLLRVEAKSSLQKICEYIYTNCNCIFYYEFFLYCRIGHPEVIFRLKNSSKSFLLCHPNLCVLSIANTLECGDFYCGCAIC